MGSQKTSDKQDHQSEYQLVLLKLEKIEEMLERSIAQGAGAAQGSPSVIKEKLSRLTVKRHAVLTASLGGVGYQEIAKIMECDVSTVKLHLKAALTMLEIPSREVLLISHKNMLDSIKDKEYETTFGIGKRWWLEQKPDLMGVLRTTKPSNNQYAKAP